MPRNIWRSARAMTKIRAIHIGLGKWGFNWATHVLPGHPDVEVVAHVDRDPAALERVAGRLGSRPSKLFTSLDEALATTESDAVIVTVPIALHEPLARQALEAGKHVVVEKPFAATLKEAQGLVQLAEARKLVLAVSQNYRFYPASRMAAELAHAGYLGKLGTIKVDFRRNAFAERSGNLLVPNPMFADMAVHHFDLMRMVIGEDPIEITGRTWNPTGSPYQMDPAGAAVLTFPGGAVVSYRGSWLDMGPQTAWAGEWQMDFERGSVLWTSRGEQPWQTKRDRVQIQRPNAQIEEIELPTMPLYDRSGVLAAFAQTIRTGVEPLFFPSGRTNVSTLAIVEASLKSAASGGASVRLDSLD